MSDTTIGHESTELARAFRPVLVTLGSCPFERPSEGLVVPCITGGAAVAYRNSIIHASSWLEVRVQTFDESTARVCHRRVKMRAGSSTTSVPHLSNSLLHVFIAGKKHLPCRRRRTKSHCQHRTEQRKYSPGGVFPERRTSIRVHGWLPSDSQFLAVLINRTNRYGLSYTRRAIVSRNFLVEVLSSIRGWDVDNRARRSSGSVAPKPPQHVVGHARDVVVEVVVGKAAAERDRAHREHRAAVGRLEEHDLGAEEIPHEVGTSAVEGHDLLRD